MRVHSTALQLYDAQVASFKKSTGTARQAWRQIPEAGFRDLKEMTSGTISSRTLRQMGRPYARNKGGTPRGVSKSYVRRNGKAKAPLLPVNQQSRRLNSSVTLWHRSTAYTLEESVGFDSAKAGRSMYAVLPRGTRYVVPRGIWVELAKRGRARLRAFRDYYIRSQRAAFAAA